MKSPNYSKSLLSLISSVMKHYGVDTPHTTLSQMDRLLEKNYKNVVVMLFDGMGDAILKKHLDASSFLRAHCQDVISSVFPPTTTCATTTVQSGLAPIEHAWLGWTLHFDEIDKNVCLFPNTEFLTDNQSEQYNVAKTYIPYQSVFEKIENATGGEVMAREISKYSSFATNGLDDICNKVKELCVQDGRKYLYTYYNQPDFDMHDFGTTSESVHNHILEIEQKVKKLCDDLTDTLVVVIADHGLVDVEWKFLPTYDDVWQCVADVPTIESRALTFFIKDGMQAQFESAFNKHFSGEYELLTKDQVFAMGLFGDGEKHPHIDSFVGDYLAVAVSNVALHVVPPTTDVFKAAHAGYLADEFDIPFIVIDRK